MGELLIAAFIGLWLTFAGAAVYMQVTKDYKQNRGKKM